VGHPANIKSRGKDKIKKQSQQPHICQRQANMGHPCLRETFGEKLLVEESFLLPGGDELFGFGGEIEDEIL
jgi:hypothetical protein